MPDMVVLQRAEANAPRHANAPLVVSPPTSTALADAAGGGGNVVVVAKIEEDGCAKLAMRGKAASSGGAEDSNRGIDHAGQCVVLRGSNFVRVLLLP